MNAKDKLVQDLAQAWSDHPTAGASFSELITAARQRVDTFVHELSDEIRNSEKLRDLTDDHMHDCNAVADFIEGAFD